MQAWGALGCTVAVIVDVILAGCADLRVPLIDRLGSDGGIAVDGEAGDVDAGSASPGGDATSDATSDAVGDADETGDAANVLGSGAFGVSSLVLPLAANVDTEDPTFTGDELELYFMSTRAAGNEDIWVARRTAKTDPWGTPQRVAELSSSAIDEGPCVARDGLTIWFDSNRGDAGAIPHIWVSSRPGRASAWGVPRLVAELMSNGIDSKPSVDDSELVMVFMSDRAGGVGGRDIYMSTRAAVSDPWGTPIDLIDVNTAADEWDPFITGQDLQLFWGANRPKEEIRWAWRTSVSNRFSPYQVLSELGTPDFDPVLSVDLRHIMFASSRSGIPQIYEAFR